MPREVIVHGSGNVAVDGTYSLWPWLISGVEAWARDVDDKHMIILYLHQMSRQWRLARCSVRPARDVTRAKPLALFSLQVQFGIRDPFEPYPHSWRSYTRGAVLAGLRVFPQKSLQESTDFLTIRSHGVVCEIPKSETFVGSEVLTRDVYDLSRLLRSDDIFLDVGAHCGLSSLKALACGCAKVICVEPVHSTFQVLQVNLRSHVFDGKAVLLQKAVAPVDTEVVCMYLHRGTAGRESRAFFNSAFQTRPHEKQPEYVQGISVISLVQTYMPTVVKIDAEGAERYLSSLDPHLFQNIRLIIGEYDFTHNPKEADFRIFEQTLMRAGFRRKHASSNEPDFVDGIAVFTGAASRNTGRLFRWQKRCFSETLAETVDASNEVLSVARVSKKQKVDKGLEQPKHEIVQTESNTISNIDRC